MISRRRPRYSDHIDYLLASIVYLGTNDEFLSRSPSLLAAELALDKDKLVAAFTAFPGIFRKAKNKSQAGEYPYALQARYALKVAGAAGDEDSYPVLPTETLRLLYDFVQKAADEERTGWRSSLSLLVSTGAALLSTGVAFYVATAKPEAPPPRICVVEQSRLICSVAAR